MSHIKQSLTWKKLTLFLIIFCCLVFFASQVFQWNYGQQSQTQLNNIIQIEQRNNTQFINHQKKVWDSLSLAMSPLYNQIQFKIKDQSQIIPSIIQVRTEDIKISLEGLHWTLRDLPSRPSLDLICVVDTSGSMLGDKIKFVISSLKEIIDFLADNDRISIVAFSNQPTVIVPLIQVKGNREMLVKRVNTISADGGTNINSGMDQAFSLLQNRKDKADVTSVFLLTDGLDNYLRSEQLANNINENQQNKQFVGNIHTFGYGRDHDSDLLSSCARKNGGEYYYVEDITSIRKYFINAFGQILSIAFPKIQIKVSIDELAKKVFSDSFKIKKVFGDMWIKGVNIDEWIINLEQFQYGVQKDFVLELEIPYIEDSLIDKINNLNLLNLEVYTENKEAKYKKLIPVKFLFAKSFALIDDKINYNDQVMVNYYRMKMVEVFEQVQKFVRTQQQNEAQISLEQFKRELLIINENRNLSDLKEMLDEVEKAISKQQEQGAEHYFTKESNRRASQKYHPGSKVGNSASLNSLQIHMDEL